MTTAQEDACPGRYASERGGWVPLSVQDIRPCASEGPVRVPGHYGAAVDMVVAAALYRGRKVLLCHRSPGRRWYPNVWDFPGGHVDHLESPRAALVRELREELAIEVAEADVAAQPHRQIVDPDFHMSVWRIESWTGEPVNVAMDEHDDMQWFGLTDALSLPLAHPTYPALLRELAEAHGMT